VTKIPFFGLKRQYENLREELLDASDRVYSSGQVLDGANVARFETAMAGRCHRQFAVAVNSCTQAIIMTQAALKISGQPVIIPTVSFVATLNSVLLANNAPAYCDVDHHGIIDLESLPYNPRAEGITALMYVNLFGNIVDYDRLRVITELFSNSKINVIEDAAQSFRLTPCGSICIHAFRPGT
jgi:dTDP-4-amino-4,6-dideoxygalactose transaminase